MGQPAADDPFSCFGDDDDDDENDGGHHISNQNHHSNAPPPKISSSGGSSISNQARDPGCGVLTFHNGTEQSLYNYVQREMTTTPPPQPASPNPPEIPAAKRVLKYIDQYCYSRHWMMHVGDQKGKILKEFVQEFCHRHQQQQENEPPETTILVELGTYCGYSAILMAQTMLDCTVNNNNSEFHIISVDVNPNHQKVAEKLVQLANLQEYISFLLLPVHNINHNIDDTFLTNHLREHLQSTAAFKKTASSKTEDSQQQQQEQIDFLFIDHDKDLYVPNLQQLESSGWIRKGTHVAADNVVFFDIPYRSYIQQLKDQGIVSSQLVRGQLEYVLPHEQEEEEDHKGGDKTTFQDGIELTVYLKDPSSISCVDKQS